jgi:predicted regulator of Ras-like GTPase activity (Roadblock/LC7/MglB family)
MQEVLERILVDFLKISGTTAAGIIDSDGLIIASQSPKMSDGELEVTGGLIAQLVSAAREVSTASGMGEVRDIISETENGKFFVLGAGDAYFWFLTEPGINLGYMRVQAKKALEKIESAIAGQ